MQPPVVGYLLIVGLQHFLDFLNLLEPSVHRSGSIIIVVVDAGEYLGGAVR